MSDVAAATGDTQPVVRTLNVLAKAGLLLLVGVALSHPDLGHLRDKAAGARAIGYPMLAFVIPAAWWVFWKDRSSYPWLADLLATLPCFTDILGNRMNLYDTVRSFDDWMHFANVGMLTASVLLLTLSRGAGLGAHVERALAFGVTAAVAWEIAEYVAFLRLYGDGFDAYGDTLGDLATGTFGALVAALVVHRLSSVGRITEQPMPWSRGLARQRPG